jgi:GNAT superfamily N-acetyltransferase
MPVELGAADVHRVRHLFDTEHLRLVMESVIAGHSPAKVWSDDTAAPGTALAWDGSHNVYIAGAVDHPDEWRRLFEVEVASTAHGMLKVHIADAAAAEMFGDPPWRWRQRVLYDLADVADRVVGAPPAGYRIGAINDRFDEFVALRNAGDVIAEIESCWPSLADFRRNGFGFCAYDDGQIVCWCTAEYVSASRCGIGIETVPTHRNSGFATSVASAFVEHCAVRGIVAHWDAWTSNVASVAVAKKLGFRVAEIYTVLVGDAADVRR